MGGQLYALFFGLLCLVGQSYAQYCTLSSTRTNSRCPTNSNVGAFRSSLSANASLLTPASGRAYMTKAHAILNSAYITSPAMIVYPATEADVIKVARFAAKHRLR